MRNNKSIFWLANKAFLAHSLLTLVGIGWAVVIQQVVLLVLLIGIWVMNLVLWLEWTKG